MQSGCLAASEHPLAVVQSRELPDGQPVLHRYLRWRLPAYDPDLHLGGVMYLYLRGMCGPDTPLQDDHPAGVFSWPVPPALVIELSDLLDGRTL